MKKITLLFLSFYLFPVWLNAAPATNTAYLIQPASLRTQLPADSIAYLRIPAPLGLMSMPKGNALDKALASAAHQQQLKQLVESLDKQTLLQSEPLLRLLLTQLRSPLEMVVLLPPAAPPTMANILARMQVKISSVEEANQLLQAIVDQEPALQLAEAFDKQGRALLKTDSLPILLRYQPKQQYLYVLSGVAATPTAFDEILATLKPITEHPMYALEQAIDSSYQGLFVWVDMQRVLPMVSASMPPQEQAQLQQMGLLETKAIALGYGFSNHKGRLKLLVDAPKAGLRTLVPKIKNEFALYSAGKPGVVASLNLPLAQLQQSFERFGKENMAQSGDWQDYLEFKQDYQKNMGISLEETLQAFGSEMIFFTDEAGEFIAIKLADTKKWQQLLDIFVKKGNAIYQTHRAHGQTWHHLQIPSFFEMIDEPLDSDISWLADIKGHSYWVEENGYLIFAQVPQALYDRQASSDHVLLKDWLEQEQRQEIDHSLLLLSTQFDKTPRYLYYFYLQFLNVIGDLTHSPVDLFTLPSAREAGLPQAGSYGLQFSMSDNLIGAELVFENNPLEIILGMYQGNTIALVGVMAAVAIPAYSDYLNRSKVAEGLGLLYRLKTPAEEFMLAKKSNKLPSVEEIGAKTSGKYVSQIYLLENGSGYAAEFYDSALSGRVILSYDPEQQTWDCFGDDMKPSFLPKSCK
ncbi:pilin [Candidatus Venteria ishoeyi]|uniref:pilin n=1 Tax=Candidatus Venteria ishoeyi TaxID=1899563 RepID=UPI0025A4F363|nr:pilin [Candidatus Venteria ishoeyi]MDM8544852.1 pilin [Candidatus Venteria ishoeyi]